MSKLQDPLSDGGSSMPTPRSQTELLTRGVLRAPDYEPAQYPDDVVNYRQYIIHEELPDDTRQGSQLLVFVRKVNSPSEFWINLSGPMYSAKLNALCHEMRNFYEEYHEDYVMPHYAVVYGQFCVSLFRNEWHRARILNVSDSTCEVSLIDFGGTVLMNHENLRFMHKKFSDLPMQSFRAEISDVRPRQSETWPNSVCEWFRMQTAGRRFIAEVKDICSQKYSLKIKLFDGSRQSISHLLVSSDMAEAETPTFKSAFEARELLVKQTANNIIMSTVSPAALTKVSASKSRLDAEERNIMFRSASSNQTIVTSRQLLDTQKRNKNSMATVSPAALTKVSTSKTGLDWDQRDILLPTETCSRQTANVVHESRELLHKHSLKENLMATVPARTLTKVPASKLESEWDQRDSPAFPETSVNDSTHSLHKHTANKSVINTDSSRALREVSISKPKMGWDENDSTWISSKTSISIEEVTISGNNLLVVKLQGREHFVLSEFVHAFIRMHEHVVLKILEVLQNSIRLVKLPEACKWEFIAQLKGRKVVGVNTNSKRQMNTIHLLPLCEVNELISFLKLDGSEIEDLQYFLLSLL